MVFHTDPFREMDRWLDTALRQVPSATLMPLDLYRDGETFVCKVDLPGVDPSTVDVDVEGRTLTIRADRRSDEGEHLQWLSHERPSGTFARQLTMGAGLDLEHIDAGYTDGVLTLRIPVAEEAKPRKIQVAHAGGRTEIEQGAPERERASGEQMS